jgi:GLPGLI family protein
MLKSLLLAASAFITVSAQAQQPEPMLFKVEYQFIHLLNKAQNDTLHNEKLVLRVSPEGSAYGRFDFETVIQKKELLPPPPPGSVTITAVGRPMAIVNDWGITDEALFFNHSKKEIQKTASVGVMLYSIKESYPTINWQITSNTKQVGEYTCQEATGTFAGRKYTAWFTTELPSQAGPWKLNGLPGTILEATDDKGEVFFIFNRIAQAKEGEMTQNELYKEPVSVTQSAFNKAKDGFDQNPSGVVQAQTGVTGNILFRFRDRNDKFHSDEAAHRLLEEKRKKTKAVLSNPLELK